MSYEDNLIQAEAAPRVRKYTFTNAAELAKSPPMEWRIRELLPRRGVAFIYGDSASGKTFVALDMAIAIARGEPWQGYKTNLTKVFYFPLEGAGIPKRLKAWEVANAPTPLPDGLTVTNEREFSFNEEFDVEELGMAVTEEAGPGAVIIIDTLARASAGFDENSSQGMGIVIREAERIATVIDGLVILVHHAGKNASAGMRGSSALYAAGEAVIEVSKDGAGNRSWKATKLKDSGDYKTHAFTLEEVQWGEDEDGVPLRSCVIRQDVVGTALALTKGSGRNQDAVVSAIQVEIGERGEVFPHSEGKRAITDERVRDVAVKALKEINVNRPSDALADVLRSAKFKLRVKFLGGGLQTAGGPKKPERIACLA